MNKMIGSMVVAREHSNGPNMGDFTYDHEN